MNFKLVSSELKRDITVVPCFKGQLDIEFETILNELDSKDIFSKKSGTSYLLSNFKDGSFEEVLFIGLGEDENLSYESLFKSLVASFKKLKIKENTSILVKHKESKNVSTENFIKAYVLSFSACNYEFNKYFSDKKNVENVDVNIFIKEIKELYNDFLQESINIKECLNITRDLVNEPANFLTPDRFSRECVELSKGLNIDVEVYDENWIREQGLLALYEVGKASANQPRFVVMKYFGDKDSEKTISLVGKGVTYDSGGYSIKSSDGMYTMKADMGGAACVLSTLLLIAKQNLKINVYGILPLCENMIGGNGFKPGDVIGSLSKKTIEILSTDAEGRLALADGVFYAANRLNTDLIVDIATLTGSCGIALGTKYAAVIDNNEIIYNKLKEACENTVESIWRLPADDDYREQLKSNIADIKNLGGRYGGTITAGLFIEEFIENKPWAHIDIAYVSFNDFPSKIYPKKGGTGAGVELLYGLCKLNQKK